MCAAKFCQRSVAQLGTSSMCIGTYAEAHSAAAQSQATTMLSSC